MLQNRRNVVKTQELNDGYGIKLIGNYRNFKPQKALTKHNHGNVIEISYCESGHQVYTVGEENYHVSGGEIFITFPHEMHSSSNYPEERGSMYWVQLNLDADNLLGLARKSSDMLKECMLSMYHRHFKIALPSAQKLITAYNFITHKNEFQLIMACSLLTLFVYDLAQCTAVPFGKALSDEIAQSVEYIGANVEKRLLAAELASLVSYSESYFKQKFKREVGMPPHEYVLRQKIEKAKKLLQYQSVTQTALALGFSSCQHFSKTFRNITGETPRGFKSQK